MHDLITGVHAVQWPIVAVFGAIIAACAADALHTHGRQARRIRILEQHLQAHTIDVRPPTLAEVEGGKQTRPMKVRVIWPTRKVDPMVAVYVDPVTARQLAQAWSTWNTNHPGQPGRELWIHDVSAIVHASIEIETTTGARPPAHLAEPPFPVRVVRSIHAEQQQHVTELHPTTITQGDPR